MKFNQISFRTKVLMIVFLASAICAIVAISGFLYFQKKSLEYGIVNKERTIQTQLAASVKFVANQGGLASVIESTLKKYNNPEQISKADKLEILKQVPIFAAMVIGKENAKLDHYNFRIFSDEPREKDYQASDKELIIFSRFEKDESLKEYIENDGQVITLFSPIRLTKAQGCLHCHGEPSTSPWQNGKDILGYKMEAWKDGKLHGVLAISQNISEIKAASEEGHIISPDNLLIVGITLGAIVALVIGFIFLRRPIQSLQEIADVLDQASTQVDGTSVSVSQSAVSLSEAATEQSAALQETSASLEQITSMIAKSSESADMAAHSSVETQNKAENGSRAVNEMLQSMEQIKNSNDAILEQVNRSNARMGEIVQVIEEISNKTRVINDIVFQTKLLSFNASVEAARAGEYGKGFSVVAEEIGNLAQMSGTAAKEITELISSSTTKVNDIVNETGSTIGKQVEDGKNLVSEGVEVANQCSRALSEIVENVQNVNNLSQEIALAAKEQTQGVGEINKALNQMNSVTQQNSAASQTAASAAEKLAGQAKDLKGVVYNLLSILNGKKEDEAYQDEPTDR